MRVCYFGIYDPEFIRNKVIISGLEDNGVKVIQCRDNSPGLKKYFILFKKYRRIRKDFDVMIVGFSGQLMIPFARLLTRKKVVLDAFVPMYDALVYNHKTVKKYGLKALYYWLLDYIGVNLASLVLTDTIEHAKYYVKHFKVKKEKCRCLYIGANTEIFKPLEKKNNSNDFIVEFHAIVYSEHGIDHILDSAKILQGKYPDIKFFMIGGSRMYEEARERARKEGIDNMVFTGRKPLWEIPRYLADSDVCLGLFGNTEKTRRVIPNKAYEIIACKRPFINARTRGIEELFESRKNCLLCEPESGESLANAIILLKNNEDLRKKIAVNGYNLFQDELAPKKIGENLISILRTELNT